MELIKEGAEAKILKLNNTTLKKLRPQKKYRIPQIDNKLRKFRNKREFKILQTLSLNQVNVPKPIEINEKKDEISFTFEYINGIELKKSINKNLLIKAFNQIIKMHKLDIIHGDLTTLNMIERKKEIYLIDFGLSEFTKKIEDKAVDLNLFFTCIKNEHPNLYKYKHELENLYEKELQNGSKIIERLHKIEHRGRNK